MAESEVQTTEVSETVKKLRETFTRLAAQLRAEDEPAVIYRPGDCKE